MVSPRLKDNKQAIRGRVTKARDAKDKENWQQNWNSRRSEYDDKKQQREKWEGAVKDLGARPGSGGDKRPQESGEKKGQGDWEMEGMEGKESLTPKAAPKKRCGQTEMRGDMRHRGPQKGQKAGEWEAYRNNNRRDAPEGKNAGEQGKGGRYLTRGRSDEPDQKKERGRYCFRMGKRALREATKRTEIQGSITAPPPPPTMVVRKEAKGKGRGKDKSFGGLSSKEINKLAALLAAEEDRQTGQRMHANQFFFTEDGDGQDDDAQDMWKTTDDVYHIEEGEDSD